jgi:hypothetical protein
MITDGDVKVISYRNLFDNVTNSPAFATTGTYTVEVTNANYVQFNHYYGDYQHYTIYSQLPLEKLCNINLEEGTVVDSRFIKEFIQ